MREENELRVMILVKATPVLTSQLEESMCVAAVTLDANPRWIRLHPIPFRDLADESKFRKYEEVVVRAIRPTSDRRPESWKPIENSIEVGRFFGTERAWSARRERISPLGERTMCELIEFNEAGSGPSTPSLAIVRPADPPQLLINPRDPAKIRESQEIAEAIAARPSLFDDPAIEKRPLEVIPWRFRYSYRCRTDECNGHKQTIIDWEVESLWRKVRNRAGWEDLMRRKFEDEMWAPTRDSVLFVGNVARRPWQFLVLGVFWPPDQPLQPSLLQ